jgi:exodeoxyribonuclease VII large subunit
LIADTRRRLEADGLLQRPRRPIPRLPAAIGVVCGHEAAVRADIESVVAARFPGYPMVFRETTVSGPGAVDSLIVALADLDAHPAVEVIVLARGGGDATALLPFSDESLCRAVCATATPVVSAIGHDGDRPLVDEVADLRAGTPSLAAGAVVPDRAELTAMLDAALRVAASVAGGRLEAAATMLRAVDRDRAILAAVQRAEARLARAAAARELVPPARGLARAEERLSAVDWRSPVRYRLDRAGRELAAHRAEVEALSPARVLERGYAVVRRATDALVVRRPDDVAAGEALVVTVAGGELRAVVTE